MGDDERSYEMRYEDENIWLTQKMMAVLYNVSVQNIGKHIKKILIDGELIREATIKKYFIVQNEGGREVSREVEHYLALFRFYRITSRTAYSHDYELLGKTT